MTSSPLLTVKDLLVEIETAEDIIVPVSKITLTILPGQIFALVGESGSGKTLTALSINRLLPDNAYLCQGTEIWLGDIALHQLSEKEMQSVRGKHIGMIFQDPALSLNPVMTIEDQLQEVFKQSKKKSTRRDNKETLITLLNRVKIADPVLCLSKYPHELSGGMKQRVMIAMALARQPALLIADEPTTALDPTTQAEVLVLLQELNKTMNMAILFITHDLSVVEKIADVVAVMQEGKLIEQHPKNVFFQQAREDYTLKLIAAMPEKLPPKTMITQPEPGEAPLLKGDDIKVYFPIRKGILRRTVGYVKAVEGLSFELYEGQTLAIVGESGSGKTTLAKAIVDLIPLASGHLYQAALLANVRGSIQMIFQDPYSSVDPRMTVKAIIEEGMIALNIGTDQEERQDRIRVLLEEVGLSSKLLSRYPHELSGGQRQRVCIARALAVGARLIICDEPTASLDVSVQAQILALLKHLQEELDVTYLFITHNIGVVKYLADNIIVMHNGKCVEQGTATQVLHSPQHPYTQSLLHATL